MTKRYNYIAYDDSGAKIKGVLIAEDEFEAEIQLRKKGLSLLSIKAENKKLSFSGSKIKSTELEQLTAELSLLLNSGVRLDSAIEILAKGVSNPALSIKLNEILDDIRAGYSLQETLKNSELFSSLYCEMIGVGESTGKLSEVFLKLSKGMEFNRQLKNKIVQASVYPMFILFVCVSAIFGIFNFIVPTMSSLFDGVDEVPAATRLLISLSDAVRENQFIFFIAIIFVICLIITSKDKKWFKDLIISLCTGVPGIRGLFILSERIGYASAMGLMLGSGVALEVAMRLSANIVRNPNLQTQLNVAREQVSQGISLSTSLADVDIIEPLMMSLIRVGEETGELDVVFERIAERARDSFEGRIVKLTSLLEPILIVSMGLLVGSVVVTMLLGIVSINDVSL